MDLDQTQTPSTSANDYSFGAALARDSSSLDSPMIELKQDEDIYENKLAPELISSEASPSILHAPEKQAKRVVFVEGHGTAEESSIAGPSLCDLDEDIRGEQIISESAQVLPADKEDKAKIIEEEIMEFAKNYSDQLLMGTTGEHNNQMDQQQQSGSGGHDLADFELPPYSGSSGSSGSSSEQAHASNQASTSYAVASSSSSSTDLTAIKNILISAYSRFSHVFHWKNPIESGVILGIGLTLITALTFFSIISVSAYTALGVIALSGLIRIYKVSMKALNRAHETPMDHIWEKALSLDVSMSPERMHKLIDVSHGNINASLLSFKQVLLVEDKFATLKATAFLYIFTYIGSWFNGLTLITIMYISLFTVPLFYEKNKTKIDDQISMVSKQISKALSLATTKASTLVFGTSSQASKKQD